AAEEAGPQCLLKPQPEVDDEPLERTIAARDTYYSSADMEPMPADVMAKLQAQAASLPLVSQQKVQVPSAMLTPAPVSKPITSGRSAPSPLTWAGWLVAAVLLFLVSAPSKTPQLSYTQLKERGALAVQGVKGPHGKDALQGEFVWDTNTQQGYMKLTGFDVNDPQVSQYQLWIFDEREFTSTTPIDGGVFNVQNKREVIIPIKPNIPVSKPTLFAITVEKPGGVMVSKRDPLVFIA
ncbi:MAG TPA: anti-sigma factor, partial [Gemmatales bacterium]|nr:anti-sigma factor [Gemmatales bacterium]